MITARLTGRSHEPKAGPDTLRLALIEPPARRTTLDGAWWPRTRSLTDELPALIQELHRRGVRPTRVAYNPASWDPAPRHLAADGRVIRLGWFRGIDPQMIDLTGDPKRGRIDLLVVPPETSAAVARRAFTAGTDRANRQEPTVLLGALDRVGSPLPRPRQPADQAHAEDAGVWESEGGHLSR